MDFSRIAGRGLVLLGCGKMGSALLAGWLRDGLPPQQVTVLEPRPSDWLLGSDVRLNDTLPPDPALVLVAVKPQQMAEALPRLLPLAGGSRPFLSIAAGTRIATYEDILGASTPLVRAMPNLPAAIGHGITAICGNARASAADLDLAEGLLQAVGQVVRLSDEAQMDAVTAVSGSGPGYVFHFIEALAAAAEAVGLPADLALQLARATVAGAGAMAEAGPTSPTQLRVDVTSPGGTTAAGLAVLMDAERGLAPLLRQAVQAAAARGKELGQ